MQKLSYYLGHNGYKIITELNEKKRFSFDEFTSLLRFTSASNEELREGLKDLLKEWTERGILREVDNEYALTDQANDKFVRLTNLGKIRDSTYWYEKSLQSDKDFLLKYYFLKYRKSVHPNNLGWIKDIAWNLKQLGNDYLERFEYWKELNNTYGQILNHLKAKLCLEKLTELEIDDEYVVKLKNHFLEDRLTEELENFLILKTHFRKCFKFKCPECGGNILNISLDILEREKKDVLHDSIIEEALRKFEVSKLLIDETLIQKAIDEIRDLEKVSKIKEEESLEKSSWIKKQFITDILYSIQANLRRKIYGLLPESDLIKDIQEQYKNFPEELVLLTTPQLFSDPIDNEIAKSFHVNEKAFEVYARTIRRLGRRGEKCVYEGLRKEHKDDKNVVIVWNNEQKESGRPYDILLLKDGIKKYIEVKTSRTSEGAFHMSKKEFNFAMRRKDRYRLYFITNAGKGVNANKEVIENFYENYSDKRFEIQGRKLVYL